MIRRSKKGFTLMEVLLALSIVGIISAFVIPQLVNATQKDRAGVILGRAVEQIEIGCQNMIQDYNNRDDADASMVDTLTAMDGEYTFTIELLGRYIGAKDSFVVPKTEGGVKHVQAKFSQYKFEKIPAELKIEPRKPIDVDENDGIVFTKFMIDVNGLNQKPNADGRDRFTFELRNDGKLIPYGLNVDTCDGDKPTIDENCTARVIRDGFKIKY